MNVLIISLNFRVAHVAHLVASYKQLAELGYKPQLLVHPETVKFLPGNMNIRTNYKKVSSPDIALFWFPAIGNIKVMLYLKRHYKSKIIYILHEPIENLTTYINAQLSIKEISMTYLRYTATLIFLSLANHIILPSEKAYNLYASSISKRLCRDYTLMPLIFADDSESVPVKSSNRNYFSYIGTIAKDHAFDEFLKFIQLCYNDSMFPKDIKFLIATRNIVDVTPELSKMIADQRLKIIDGHPLTEEEINDSYASSFAVWNAYHRTTQSGVLAKASMFGTPALVSRKNLSEFSIDGKNVIAVEDNNNYEELRKALLTVKKNFSYYSQQSRDLFLSKFFYRKSNDIILSIIKKVVAEK